MVFTEHMKEGYTDSSHFNKVLKSLDSQEVMSEENEFKIERETGLNDKTMFYTFHYSPDKESKITSIRGNPQNRRHSKQVRLQFMQNSNKRNKNKPNFERKF